MDHDPDTAGSKFERENRLRNRAGGPNGTRSNLHNSSARFHCTLIVGSPPLLAALTGSVSMWLRGLDLNHDLWVMRASALSTADDTRPTEQAFPRRLFVSFGRLSDGQPGKCTESSSGQPGHFTERPSVRREPALLAGRRKVTSLPQARAPSYRRDRSHRPGRRPFHASVTISTHGGPLWRWAHG